MGNDAKSCPVAELKWLRVLGEPDAATHRSVPSKAIPTGITFGQEVPVLAQDTVVALAPAPLEGSACAGKRAGFPAGLRGDLDGVVRAGSTVAERESAIGRDGERRDTGHVDAQAQRASRQPDHGAADPDTRGLRRTRNRGGIGAVRSGDSACSANRAGLSGRLDGYRDGVVRAGRNVKP